MRLTDLTELYKGSENPDISGITLDSRKVQKGWLFAALPGAKFDGRNFIGAAARNGAVAILTPRGTDVPDGVICIEDDNPRRTLALMAARFYGRQPEYIAAVTGTNGKTSTVYFTQQLWEMLGHKSASLGTLGVKGEGVERSGSLTTPDPVSLQEEVAGLAESGVTHLAVEASSHGLDQHRLDGLKVTAAGFTNISRDHLDYHETMEAYLAAKSRLFSDLLAEDGTAVLNTDVPEYGALKGIAEKRGVKILSYGTNGEALRLLERVPTSHGQDVKLEVGGREYGFTLPLVGDFQVMNALCAAGLVLSENLESVQKVIEGLSKIKGAPGRLELVSGHPAGAAVYVDYAHTPDALDRVLDALRPHTDGRLFCIIGCGGDRDKGKRPLMAQIAFEKADVAIITDDNPRSEDPAAIRADMMAGAPQAREIGDRREAIHTVISELQKGDILVIAGKGHETGQIINGVVEPFDDVAEAKAAISSITDLSKQTGVK